MGGWGLNPAGIERAVLATRTRLGRFCRSGSFDPRTVGVEGLRDALRRLRSKMLEREDDDERAVVAVASRAHTAAHLRSRGSDLRRLRSRAG